jgi:hypothetical protein
MGRSACSAASEPGTRGITILTAYDAGPTCWHHSFFIVANSVVLLLTLLTELLLVRVWCSQAGLVVLFDQTGT